VRAWGRTERGWRQQFTNWWAAVVDSRLDWCRSWCPAGPIVLFLLHRTVDLQGRAARHTPHAPIGPSPIGTCEHLTMPMTLPAEANNKSCRLVAHATPGGGATPMDGAHGVESGNLLSFAFAGCRLCGGQGWDISTAQRYACLSEQRCGSDGSRLANRCCFPSPTLLRPALAFHALEASACREPSRCVKPGDSLLKTRAAAHVVL